MGWYTWRGVFERTTSNFELSLPNPGFCRKTEISPLICNETFTLPACTRQLIKVSIHNREKSQGHVPRINAGSRIFLGKVIIKNKNRFAHLFAINSTTKPINITLSPLILENFEERPPSLMITTD